MEEIRPEEALNFQTRSGGENNFFDLLRRPTTELRSYKFWGLRDGARLGLVMALSPDDSLSIYSDVVEDSEIALAFAVKMRLEIRLILGDVSLDKAVENILGQRVEKHRPYHYMKKKPEAICREASSVRLAGRGDQNIVNFWYKSFNAHEGADWSVPDLSQPNPPKLFLALEKDVFRGGCANTLNGENRLWIGRLFVAPEFRKAGVARQLMNRVEDEELGEGKTVDLLVNVSNRNAIDFYKKRNYRIAATNAFWVIN